MGGKNRKNRADTSPNPARAGQLPHRDGHIPLHQHGVGVLVASSCLAMSTSVFDAE